MKHDSEFLPVARIDQLTELRRRNARLKSWLLTVVVLAAAGWIFWAMETFGL